MTPSTTLSADAVPDRLPVGALLALAMTGFICIVTETLPAGLLPLISDGLGVSASMAGQMVTAYA
ncbi:MAG: MFS transporter, partial [Pseudomonas sp.]